MATQLGRISGPLLFANLLRDGVDLDFKNTISDPSLLHLNVNDKRIGVNTEAPSRDLSVNNTINSVNAVARDQTDIADISISDSQIDSLVGNLVLQAQDYINFTGLQVDDVRFDFNNISTYTPNTNVELRPAGTGIVELFSNLRVNADLHATGDITLDGNIIFGDDSIEDTVSVLSNIDSDVVPTLNNSYLLGESLRSWNYLYVNNINANTSSDILNTENILITDTLIRATQSDSNLKLVPTGNVKFDDVIIDKNKIYTEFNDIIISVNNNSVIIDSTGSVMLSQASTNQTTSQQGNLRYNIDYNVVEGYSTGNIFFGGVWSDDKQTSITALEDVFVFEINGSVFATLDNTSLKSSRFEANDIGFDKDTISTISSNSNLEIRQTGDNVKFKNNILIKDNRIVHNQNNQINISHTNLGFAKFNTPTALATPTGNNTTRPSEPEIGQTRYNTDRSLTEVWNGTNWVKIGIEETITTEEFENIQHFWTLILG